MKNASGAVKKNEPRHPAILINTTINGAAAAAPNVSAVLVNPFGSPHPETGNQLAIIPPVTGKIGACEAPVMNRNTIKIRTTVVTETIGGAGIIPFKIVKTPHNTAITVIALRDPSTSPKTPPGNWNTA